MSLLGTFLLVEGLWWAGWLTCYFIYYRPLKKAVERANQQS